MEVRSNLGVKWSVGFDFTPFALNLTPYAKSIFDILEFKKLNVLYFNYYNWTSSVATRVVDNKFGNSKIPHKPLTEIGIPNLVLHYHHKSKKMQISKTTFQYPESIVEHQWQNNPAFHMQIAM